MLMVWYGGQIHCCSAVSGGFWPGPLNRAFLRKHVCINLLLLRNLKAILGEDNRKKTFYKLKLAHIYQQLDASCEEISTLYPLKASHENL